MNSTEQPVSAPLGITRAREGRVIAGVAAGIARKRHWDPFLIRCAFVVLALAGGSGLVLYVAAWLFLPWEGDHEAIAHRAIRERRALPRAIAVGVAVLATLVVLRSLGLWWSDSLVWPAALAATGLTVIWLEADDEDRAMLSGLAERLPTRHGHGRSAVARLRWVVGALLIVGGVTVFLAANHALQAVRTGVVPLIGVIAGLALVFLPWWRRLVVELGEERRARARSQERAEMAAHLHDSVLQTLALIQRRADDPKTVVSLARSQERELRSWLFDGDRRPGDQADGSLGAAIRTVADDVEVRHGVPVEVVTVGDCPLDDRLDALVAAAREAIVNAAKWSKADTVSVYVEVEPAAVTIYVRDRGAGFDPGQVAPERQGIAESIRGRMSRHGGTAVLRSSFGEGTEVELRVPVTRGP
ncbi:MAG TPA: PspC domain-containing protein [Acidimicrobiales bacterium]|nr:PspC domain-containing protein [Acidimicrobiales bacterium]